MTETESLAGDRASTRQRLLIAARELFAEKGFDGTSVGEICDRAGANRAAISFHFGGKQRLYVEVVKDAHRQIIGEVPMPHLAPGTPAAERLTAFMKTLLARMTREDDPNCSDLMMREMAHPTGACEEIVGEFIRPMADELMSILDEMLPAVVPFERRYMLGFSLVGQCLFYRQNRPVAGLLMGPDRFAAMDPARLADHVATVALAAVAAVAAEYEGPKGRASMGGRR